LDSREIAEYSAKKYNWGQVVEMSDSDKSRYAGYYTGRVVQYSDYKWGDIALRSTRSLLGRGAEGAAYRRNHKLYVTVGGGTSRTVVQTEGAPPYDGRDVPGHVSFIPAERQNRGWYSGRFLDTVSLEIPQEVFAKCLEGCDCPSIEFLPVTNSFDPLIFHAVLALEGEAEAGGVAAKLFAETASTLIALHLLRHCSNNGRASLRHERSLLAKRDFRKTIDFIEDNLDQELALDTLAAVAELPVSTFVRQFIRAHKMPPHKFVVLRRIEHARDLLTSSQLSIAEIAYELGFSSQGHFSTVFRKYVGVSPATFRHGSRVNAPRSY
jgi:AraC family transcriptional regulator